jgi:hypothetical protein
VVLAADAMTVDDVDFGFGSCSANDGDLTGLSLRFLGDEEALVEIKKKVDDDDTLFSAVLAPGEAFSFLAPDDDGKGGKGKGKKGKGKGGKHGKHDELPDLLRACVDGELAAELEGDDLFPGMTVGPFEVLAVQTEDGFVCRCGPCEGGLLSITLTSGLLQGAHVEVKRKESDKDKDVVFSDYVEAGGTFTVEGNKPGGKLHSQLMIFVDGELDVAFKANCGHAPEPGDELGHFTVGQVISKAGPLCDHDGTVVPQQALCDLGKPQAILAEFTGDGADVVVTDQADGKWFVEDLAGGPEDLEQAWIVARDKGGKKVWFSGLVSVGEVFAIDAAALGKKRLKSHTYVDVYDAEGGQLLQTIFFHTSCSQPLFEGDQYGAVRLAGYIPAP